MAYLLSQLLTASAARHPDRPAVSFRGRSLTYAELDGLSNRMARTLREAGIARGDRVAIYLDKSVEAVLAIFAVLKADATYVPLDPTAPVGRLAYIARNCGARCLISSASKAGRVTQLLEQAPAVTLVALVDEGSDRELGATRVEAWPAVLRRSDAPLDQESIESDLAYILYTSGSTGEPKGVMISHRNALTFVDWACEAFALGPEDRVANHAPLHFDLSIFDVFSTAEAGACIYPVPAETARFPMELSRFIEREQISVWYSVPSALILLLQHGQVDKRDLSQLRAVLFAGEVFPAKHLRALMQMLPAARYYNLYGPTETNVVTWHEVESPPEGDQPIPIGRACANMEVFALGERGELVTTPGAEGELYARGPTVARGYCGDPERTARLFVRNPLDPEDVQRVYRTGDLVRLDDAGNYHFLGRRDNQVKVQGYRVELGEVETALLGHAAVAEAVVLAAEDERRGTYLRGFVALTRGCNATVEELKRHCAQSLPPYMVPAQVEILDMLPRTSTGKADRVRLAAFQ